MNSILRAWHAIPMVPRMALATLGVGLAGTGAIALALSPVRTRTAALEIERVALQGQLDQARVTVAALARSREESAELQRRLEPLAAKLPAEREIPAVYRTLHDAARETGLAVSLFQPREARVRDHFAEIPIAMAAEGTYHQLGAFLERLTTLPRLVTVSGLTLTGIERPAASLRAELTLATYVYRPARESAAAARPDAARDPGNTAEYSARGRRDPFGSVALASTDPGPRRRPALAAATVTGIVRGPDGPIALVETGDGGGHILRAGDGVDGARVIRIGPDSVILEVLSGTGASGERIILSLGQR